MTNHIIRSDDPKVVNTISA